MKYLKLIACSIGILLLLVSCIPWWIEEGGFWVLCKNHSADTIHVSFFGHEIGKERDGVAPLSHYREKVDPYDREYCHIKLNWDMGDEWEGIWCSYGIDTLYVVFSKSDIKNKSSEGFYPWNDDDALKVMKYTKGDYPLDTHSITVTYP